MLIVESHHSQMEHLPKHSGTALLLAKRIRANPKDVLKGERDGEQGGSSDTGQGTADLVLVDLACPMH